MDLFNQQIENPHQDQPATAENIEQAQSVQESQLQPSDVKPGSGAFPLPQLTQNPGVLPEDSFAEAGRKIILFQFAQMLSQEAGTIQGVDIEALHDMRVATRRLRAAFAIFADAFKPKKVKSLLKGLRLTGRALGQVRDLDVFIETVNHYLAALPEDQKNGLNSLLQAWQVQWNDRRTALITHLESPAYQEFKHNLNTFLNMPGAGAQANLDIRLMAADGTVNTRPEKIRQIVPLLIYTRLAAVSAYEAILPTATIPQLHALRIEFKRLRYAIEFFTEILGPQAKMVIDELKQIQDHLGALHDADVACFNLSTVITNWENQHNQIPIAHRPEPGAVIAYLAHCSNERHRLLSSFQKAWENYHRPEVRQNLALAIAVL